MAYAINKCGRRIRNPGQDCTGKMASMVTPFHRPMSKKENNKKEKIVVNVDKNKWLWPPGQLSWGVSTIAMSMSQMKVFLSVHTGDCEHQKESETLTSHECVGDSLTCDANRSDIVKQQRQLCSQWVCITILGRNSPNTHILIHSIFLSLFPHTLTSVWLEIPC